MYLYLFQNKRHQGVHEGAFIMCSLYCLPVFDEFSLLNSFVNSFSEKCIAIICYCYRFSRQREDIKFGSFCVFLQIAPNCKHLSNDNCIYLYCNSVLYMLETQDDHYFLKCNICYKIGSVVVIIMHVIIIWTSAEIFDFPIKSPLRNVL